MLNLFGRLVATGLQAAQGFAQRGVALLARLPVGPFFPAGGQPACVIVGQGVTGLRQGFAQRLAQAGPFGLLCLLAQLALGLFFFRVALFADQQIAPGFAGEHGLRRRLSLLPRALKGGVGSFGGGQSRTGFAVGGFGMVLAVFQAFRRGPVVGLRAHRGREFAAPGHPVVRPLIDASLGLARLLLPFLATRFGDGEGLPGALCFGDDVLQRAFAGGEGACGLRHVEGVVRRDGGVFGGAAQRAGQARLEPAAMVFELQDALLLFEQFAFVGDLLLQRPGLSGEDVEPGAMRGDGRFGLALLVAAALVFAGKFASLAGQGIELLPAVEREQCGLLLFAESGQCVSGELFVQPRFGLAERSVGAGFGLFLPVYRDNRLRLRFACGFEAAAAFGNFLRGGSDRTIEPCHLGELLGPGGQRFA